MFHTALTPPTVDQAAIDYYVAKGKRERSRALTQMVRSLFSAPEPQPALQAESPA